jgi:hypothetical protein
VVAFLVTRAVVFLVRLSRALGFSMQVRLSRVLVFSVQVMVFLAREVQVPELSRVQSLVPPVLSRVVYRYTCAAHIFHPL